MQCTVKALIILVLVSVAACGHAAELRLGNSQYFVVRSDKIHAYIVRRSRSASEQATIAINSSVIGYQVTDTAAAVVRQVVRSYECGDRTIATEVLDAFEYWLIDLDRSDTVGPFSWRQFRGLLSERPDGHALMLPNEEVLLNTTAAKPRPLMQCDRPRKIL